MIDYYIVDYSYIAYEKTDLDSGLDYRKRLNIGTDFYHHLGII